MDFKAALINNINVKPFVPSNLPPFYSVPQEAMKGEFRLPSETPSRRRRRRRNNAARRQEREMAATLADEQYLAPKQLTISTSQCSLPTPPSSNPHTPLKTEFAVLQEVIIPQYPPKECPFSEAKRVAFEAPNNVESEMDGPPMVRILEASPVPPPFSVNDPMERMPASCLEAIASRARDRLAARVQAYLDEQQNVINAATRIQEAYSTHIEGQLEQLAVGLKGHLEAEMDRKFGELQQKHCRRFSPDHSTMDGNVGHAQDDRLMTAILSQLQAHSNQLRLMALEHQSWQHETAEVVKGMRTAMEEAGLLPSTRDPRILLDAPLFDNAFPNTNASHTINVPHVLALNNGNITPVAAHTHSKFNSFGSDAKAGVIRKPVLGPANKAVRLSQSVNTRWDKENQGVRRQVEGVALLNGRSGSPRL